MLPLLLTLCLLAAVPVLAWRGVRALLRRDGERPRSVSLLRGLATLVGALTVALYAWGMLNGWLSDATASSGGTDSSPPQECRTEGWQDRPEITGHHLDYVPLRFVCTRADGSSYATDDVPAYVNPAVFGAALTTAALFVAAGVESERRERAAPAGQYARSKNRTPT
ncbi:hypothetical protein [Streptomyces avicenniae]|uniref:hypothetical protein n=1 Tax=Streptomyces avicenniae TaxID=500153 RepID=UPI000AB179CA|nr:hypothetical protein [Streptomyces avicenniae]